MPSPGCIHVDLYSWCSLCNTSGPYYFGDNILNQKTYKGNLSKAEVLERVLEIFDIADPERIFTTREVMHLCGCWQVHLSNGVVYAALRWLTHIGIIHNTKGSKNRNLWHVSEQLQITIEWFDNIAKSVHDLKTGSHLSPKASKDTGVCRSTGEGVSSHQRRNGLSQNTCQNHAPIVESPSSIEDDVSIEDLVRAEDEEVSVEGYLRLKKEWFNSSVACRVGKHGPLCRKLGSNSQSCGCWCHL